MKKNEKIGENSFLVVFVLFVFQIVNRELSIFIDTRIIIIALSLISIAFGYKRLSKLYNSFSKLIIILFLAWSLFTVIFVKFRPFYNSEVWQTDSINMIILYLYLILVSILLFMYSDRINFKLFYYTLMFSMLFNLVACFLLYFKLVTKVDDPKYILPLSQIHGYVFGDIHTNFFGNPFRIAGYSEDANYLSLNAMVLFMLSIIDRIKRKVIPKSFFLLSIATAALSFFVSGSKTILLAMLIILSWFLLKNKMTSSIIILSFFFLSGMSILFSIIPNILDLGDSLNNRLFLWNRGLDVFLQNPLFGGGLSSFRHYGAEIDWVVHPHNTYIQTLSELGIFGLVLLFIVFSNSVNSIKEKVFLSFSILNLVLWINFDISYTNYTLLFLIILPMVSNNYDINHLKEKKIMILSNGLSNGGAERMVYDLSTDLSKKEKYRVDLILTDSNDEKNSLEDLFDKTNINFNIFQISTKKHELIKNNFRILKLIIKNKPDVVHTHQITLIYCVLGYLLGGNFVKIHTVHNDSTKEFGSKLFRKIYNILFFVFRIHVVSISKYIESTSKKEYNFVSKRYHHMIYNGRSIEKTKQFIKKTDLFNIIMIGRLTEVKNHEAAINIMNIIVKEKKIKNIYLKIYGEGEKKKKLIDKIRQLKIEDNISLAGITSNISDELNKSSLFLMTSIHEGFPISAIEALQAGLPLILSDFGSAYELVDGNGYVVDKKNYEEFADKIVELYIDQEKHRKYSEQSRKLSNHFRIEMMSNEYSNLYEQLIGEIL